MGQFVYVRASPVSIRICVCQIWLRSDGRVGKGGGGTDRQTDKVTLLLYIVDMQREKQREIL